VWFVKMGGGFSGWFMLCMGDGVKNRFVVTHGNANGRWEL
jgi:hypothetical protein